LSGLHYLERAQQMRSMQMDADLTLGIARGLRERPEMMELVRKMREADWETYVITASPEWEVQVFAERYDIPPERVIGMRREVRDGVITAELEPPCSWGDGKLDAYQMFVSRERPPNFCAGDSVGDWTMLEWATDCALVVEPSIESLKNFARWKKSLGESWLIQGFE
jgi:phosphoserine phosphatase